jgi:uncharacterized membrane protein YkoI
MKDKLKSAAGAAVVVAALGLGGTAIATASGSASDDNEKDTPITGQALQRATTVALHATGGGKVTDSEVGDEEGAYEVEVTRADASQVDVHLDKAFNVIDQSSDGHAGETDSPNED